MTTSGKIRSGKNLALIAATILAGAPMVSNADAITYDFTGTVTSSDFATVTSGMTITGTYTINLANADPLSSFNDITSGSEWGRAVYGGSVFGVPAPPGTVFSSTATAGSFVYASSAPSGFGSYSSVSGSPDFFYGAFDYEYSNNSSYTESLFDIYGSTIFSSTGLPLFGSGSTGNGAIFFGDALGTGTGRQVDYSITSLRPVTSAPEIDPASWASGVTLLFGSLFVMHGRRKVLRPSHF